jgi:peptide deformylase
MNASPSCVGLAAPQIGVSQKVFVADVSGHSKVGVSHGLIVMADPIVIARTGSHIGREGCMSVPDLTANVTRAEAVEVAGWALDGSSLTIETSGFEARALQHEIDHLEGMLILDRVSSLTTDVFARRVYR